MLAGCGGSIGEFDGPVGHDPRGDLRYMGTRNPWEFLDIREFAARAAGESVEGYILFDDEPLKCPHCEFTVTFKMGTRYLIAEWDTSLDDVVRRTVFYRFGSDDPESPYQLIDDDFHVAEHGNRLEFKLPVTVEPGAVMNVESYHDEGPNLPWAVRAIDITDTPYRIPG